MFDPLLIKVFREKKKEYLLLLFIINRYPTSRNNFRISMKLTIFWIMIQTQLS